MARMHSRRKGKAGSNKPKEATKKSWIRYAPKEVEMLVAKLGKEGKSGSEIGMILRDTYGIPDVKALTGETISKILGDKKLLPKLPEDLIALLRRIVLIRKHIEKNAKDQSAKRGLILTESKIRRLVKYYKITGKVPVEWKYEPEKIRLYIE
ncbi:MAG: 30S ribosomal protein S15 [Candidatus Woesearchaeota archaeon]|nr:30S ribosomal protein S15 [Candidatus Woesearchaeota archaeon]